jgi:hypothetical protein
MNSVFCCPYIDYNIKTNLGQYKKSSHTGTADSEKSVVFTTKTLFQPNLAVSVVSILLQYDLR